jgi:hypothetical protein
MVNFPKTLAACQSAENSQWAIGDALLKDKIDEGFNGSRGLKAVSKELAEYGIEYAPNTLSELRETARLFPPARRHAKVSFAAHRKAWNPDILDTIVKAAKKDGDRVTQDYVELTVVRMAKDARKEREKAKAEADREATEAEAAKDLARRKEREAKDVEERKRAERDRKDAEAKHRKAVERVKATKVEPKKGDRVAPDVEDVPRLVAVTTFSSNATDAKRLAKKTSELLKAHIDTLTDDYVVGMVEEAMAASDAWREVADMIRKASSNKRGHLSIVA